MTIISFWNSTSYTLWFTFYHLFFRVHLWARFDKDSFLWYWVYIFIVKTLVDIQKDAKKWNFNKGVKKVMLKIVCKIL